jgi:hypothetical protein
MPVPRCGQWNVLFFENLNKMTKKWDPKRDELFPWDQCNIRNDLGCETCHNTIRPISQQLRYDVGKLAGVDRPGMPRLGGELVRR